MRCAMTDKNGGRAVAGFSNWLTAQPPGCQSCSNYPLLVNGAGLEPATTAFR